MLDDMMVLRARGTFKIALDRQRVFIHGLSRGALGVGTQGGGSVPPR